MKNETRKLLARWASVAAIAVGTFALGYWLSLPPEPSSHLAGFVKLQPATAYHAPGTFNTVEQESDDSVILHPTCDIDPAEFEDRIIRADTLDETIKHALSVGYAVEPSQWKDLELSLELDSIKDIRISYTGSKVWMLSAQTIRFIRDKYLRGDCQTTIMDELKKGFKVCQSKSVIISDVVFKVSRKTEVATGLEIMDADLNADGSHSIKGKRIFHAVKLDEACFLLNEGSSASSDPLTHGVTG
jgi:hypothetical protein